MTTSGPSWRIPFDSHFLWPFERMQRRGMSWRLSERTCGQAAIASDWFVDLQNYCILIWFNLQSPTFGKLYCFRLVAWCDSTSTSAEWQELKDGCTTARGRFVPAPRWFPFSQTMSLGCDARTLRREQNENPKSALSRLGDWLTKSSAEGRASRQEVVSTVPVALLRIEPQHVVLDLCAAPGSKTLQALETAGAVVANELSASRACVLARRCSLHERAASAAVVQHKAQTFPDSAVGFDRIICDVPCSGDGTMRKHPEKWRSWSPHLGRELHSRQLQIALRAMALLKVGGLMSQSWIQLNHSGTRGLVS